MSTETIARNQAGLKLAELDNLEARQLLIMCWAYAYSVNAFQATVEEAGTAGYEPRNGMKALAAERRMNQHIAIIMMLLIRVEAPFPVILAGAVHDIGEWKQGEDEMHALEEKLRDYEAELLAGAQDSMSNGHRLVPRVRKLISAVCEPPKKKKPEDEQAWRERKWAYVRSLEVADTEVALLSLSTKIHGLMEVVKVLSDGGTTENWSAAGHAPNCDFFRALLAIYERRRLPDILLDIYRHLLGVFVSFGR